MELFSIVNGQKKRRIKKINDDLNKYKNDPRVLKKRAEDIKSIEENGGFEAIFDALRKFGYYDTVAPLATANEPPTAYGKPKETEE